MLYLNKETGELLTRREMEKQFAEMYDGDDPTNGLDWTEYFEETAERSWELGDDIESCDNLLDGITFDELITTIHCNCKTIDSKAVYAELKQILAIRRQDMMCLVERNMDAIIAAAKKGRE